MYDIVLKNGKIIDGTGSPWYYADIGIQNGEIAFIGKIPDHLGKKLFDVSNRYISPGFIDMHSHSDLYILEQPYLSAKIRQGITTDLLGQDGIAAAPLPKELIPQWQGNLAGLDGQPNIVWDWYDVDSYLTKIEEAKPSYNLAFLVPHGNIRMQVMGLQGRPAIDEEIMQMQEILRESLAQGACGLSSGLIYPPCVFAEMKEIEGLCRVAAEFGVPFIVHQRSEGDEILESMDELIEMARRTGVHLHFSHFKVCGQLNWHKTELVLAKLDQARAEGLEVTFDQYPYTAGSTMLSAILPPWAHEGGSETMLERLRDASLREKMKQQMKEGLKGWDSISAWAGWAGIFITSVGSEQNRAFVGRHLQEIAQLRGESDPADTAFHLILEEKNAVGMIDFVMDEDSVSAIMRHPAGTICTDGLLGGEPHPRAYGSFPRVLGKYVREEKVFSLEEAIRRMTSQPARIIGFTDRGVIRQGAKADLVVFDADKVIDTAAYNMPKQAPIGIEMVIVNGEVVVEGDKEHVVPAGQVLRRQYKK